VVRRHNALRTTFAAEAAKPFQVVSYEPRFEFVQRDVSAEPDPEAAAQQAVDELVSTPFDLARGPLVRALLLRLAETDHVLELVFDHIICDGWSEVVIFDELAKLYDGFRRGEDPGLTPPEMQYDDHAREARAVDRRGHRGEARVLAPATQGYLAPDCRRIIPGLISQLSGGTLRTHLPKTTAEAIRTFARAEGTTLS
jgi:NRPS condensation-like uncharacterized protein